VIAALAPLTVTPAAPRVDQAITLRFRAPGRTPRGARLTLAVRVLGVPRSRSCTARASVVRTARAGAVVRVTLRPSVPAGAPAWCAGSAQASARVVGPSGAVIGSAVMRRLTLRGAGGTAPPLGTPILLTVAGASTATVSAPGRSDRVGAISGALRGIIPGPLKLNSPDTAALAAGSLVLSGLPGDPLCTADGAAEPREFPIAEGAGSSMTLQTDGHVDLTLVVRRDLFAFTGCLPAVLTPTTGATRLALAGDVGPGGLLALRLSGSAGPLALAGVGDATVTLRLVLRVDL
jgi:hypothetical protein